MDESPRNINDITGEVIGSAIKVHSALGPGMLESAYEKCLIYELSQRRLTVENQVLIPLVYQGIRIEAGFRADIRVDHRVLVEIKAVEMMMPVHVSQLLSYLRLSGCEVGLLINFNVPRLVDGITRLRV